MTELAAVVVGCTARRVAVELAGWLSIEWRVADDRDGAELVADVERGLARIGAPLVDEPLLGLATTRQLLDELVARAEVGGYAEYRTVD